MAEWVEPAPWNIKIQAASVNTGSSMKDGKLKSKDFFDAEHDPLITFHSTKVIQTGPDMLDYVGEFTIRGVTKTEKLTFTLSSKGTGSGEIKGTMAFDRKNYGMNKGIPVFVAADLFNSKLIFSFEPIKYLVERLGIANVGIPGGVP